MSGPRQEQQAVGVLGESKMKKLLFLAFLLVASVLVEGLLVEGPAAAADPFIVGIIAPTTGPLTTVGLRQLLAVQWWEKVTNAAGGIKGRPVQVVHCNDEGSPDKAAACARDLIAKGSVVLLNASVTGPIRATMPLVQNGPVMITPSPNVVPDPSTFVFQTSPSDFDVTTGLAEFLLKNNVHDLAMLASTDASGEVGVASAKAVFPAHGIKYDLARIDLRANDASIQLANVVKPDVKAVFSNYSGGGAAAVVKSFANLGLTQPLIVSYANLTDAFIQVIKNDMPKRLLGTGVQAVFPELLQDPARRKHVEELIASYTEVMKDKVDMATLLGSSLSDTADAILRNVDDPSDPKAARDYLETHVIHSVQDLHWSKDRHVGMSASDVAILEYKNGKWVKADPIQ
jgi:ABC-type branched-subunit amino acid transport system substrate-binding protein